VYVLDSLLLCALPDLHSASTCWWGLVVVPLGHPVCCLSVLQAILYSEWKLLLLHQPAIALNKMQFITSIELLHVLVHRRRNTCLIFVMSY